MPLYEHVLVTGASRGLGAALAQHLLASGYRVVLTARTNAALEAACAALRAKHGDRVQSIVADLADPAVAGSLVERVESRFGALDALINNAGAGSYKPLIEWTRAEVLDCMNLNLLAPMLLSQSVLPGMMARRRGFIINVASDLARRPLANMAPYVAAKHGLLGFSGSLLRESKGQGVKVCSVLPGIIDTGFNGALEGSKPDTWAMRPAMLAERIVELLTLPENVVVDELTIHPLQQDF